MEEISPDIVAPGFNILAQGGVDPVTYPTEYMEISGTSMATPHVGGAAALIKQAKPDWNPLQIKSAMMTTSKFRGVVAVNAYVM